MKSDNVSEYSKWDSFELPQLTENNYGVNWPAGMSQLAKELLCFKHCMMKQPMGKMAGSFTHFLNLTRMLFQGTVDIYKDVPKGRIWNNYFLDIAELLCEGHKRNVLCGPASANKTFISALFVYLRYVCAPNETLVMASTTSGSASERRIWADIKDFHRLARFVEHGMKPPGEIIEYLKAIVFDPMKELGGSDKNNRDFRNGMQVIPIATDASGESALTTIQGSKNRFVIWVLDEMTQMQDGVTRPNRNLNQNEFFQFIGIGNSNSPTDPHGKECMPKEGLAGLNHEIDRRWVSAKGAHVLFVHGDETPNNHPYVDRDSILTNSDYPYPYASNPTNSLETAIDCGDGDAEAGKQTIDYWKFCIGFWAPLEASSSLYTRNLFTSNKADQPGDRLISNKRKFGAGDFAFTAEGDANTFIHATVGYTENGSKQIHFSKEAKSIKVKATSKDEFNKAVAGEFVDSIKAEGIKYEDFGADASNDAAITLNEMSRLAGTYDFHGISSQGNAVKKEKYNNKVTELWFQARDLIRTGICRGINLQSKYYQQLCDRRYESLSKGFYKIERKKDMKKRTGRSPDDADAFIYLCYMIIRSGIVDDELSKAREIVEQQEAAVNQFKIYDDTDASEQEEEFQLTDYNDEVDEYSLIW